MQATTSSAMWPPEQPAPSTIPMPGARALRFGHRVAGAVEWSMRRNCSLAPRQLFAVYLSFCFISLLIAGFMWIQGAVLVMPFASLELIGLGVALLVYSRHANDAEAIVLRAGRLVVEQRCAQQTQRTEFEAAWLRVEPEPSGSSLIELSGDGRHVSVGRYVRPELREALARELRGVLHGWRQHGAL